MCDPSTINMVGQAGMVAQAAGGAAAAYGAYSKSKAEKTAYDIQAQVADNNKQYANWQAEDAIRRGQKSAVATQLKARQLKGSQIASFASRGIDLGEGSALNILTDTDYMGAIDSNTVMDNAAKEAWMYRTQASNYGSNADLLRYRAKSTSGYGEAAGTLLTTAGSVASRWYDWKVKSEKTTT